MSVYTFEDNQNSKPNTNPAPNPQEPVIPAPSEDSNTKPATTPSNTNSDWKPEDVPQLTVDVYKKDQSIFVVSTVAGVDADDLDISIDNQTLTIRGMRKKPYSQTNTDLLLEECFWGEFYRELTINENLNVSEIKADLKNGVLIIQIPVIKVVAQKKIKVNAG